MSEHANRALGHETPAEAVARERLGRIRELEADVARKDAALAAANCELQGIGLLARDSKISAETRGRELEDRAFLIEEVLAEVRTALTEVEK